MMSLEYEEIAKEFLEIKKSLEEIGFELVGSKDISDEKLYLVKKKKSN